MRHRDAIPLKSHCVLSQRFVVRQCTQSVELEPRKAGYPDALRGRVQYARWVRQLQLRTLRVLPLLKTGRQDSATRSLRRPLAHLLSVDFLVFLLDPSN